MTSSRTIAIYLLPVLLFIATSSFARQDDFELNGTITPAINGKAYLFYEGNFENKDSLVTEVKNGKFYFREKMKGPVLTYLCIANSTIAGFHLENSRQHVNCSVTPMAGTDSVKLEINSVIGSNTENLKRELKERLLNVNAARDPEEQERIRFNILLNFVKDHKYSKASAWAIERAAIPPDQKLRLYRLLVKPLRDSYDGMLLKQTIEREKLQAGAAGKN